MLAVKKGTVQLKYLLSIRHVHVPLLHTFKKEWHIHVYTLFEYSVFRGLNDQCL